MHANESARDVIQGKRCLAGWIRGALPKASTVAVIVALFLLLPGGDAAADKDVRYEPSPMPVVRAMLALAGVGAGDVVYDLGSGDGRIPITAAAELGARGVGVEIDSALIEQARAHARAAGVEHKVEFVEGDMYDADLRAATVVTLFLHPEPNLKLRPKLLAQLKPGARVVSYIWDMGDWKPEAVRRINDRTIYLWRIPQQPLRLQLGPERSPGASGAGRIVFPATAPRPTG